MSSSSIGDKNNIYGAVQLEKNPLPIFIEKEEDGRPQKYTKINVKRMEIIADNISILDKILGKHDISIEGVGCSGNGTKIIHSIYVNRDNSKKAVQQLLEYTKQTKLDSFLDS